MCFYCNVLSDAAVPLIQDNKVTLTLLNINAGVHRRSPTKSMHSVVFLIYVQNILKIDALAAPGDISRCWSPNASLQCTDVFHWVLFFWSVWTLHTCVFKETSMIFERNIGFNENFLNNERLYKKKGWKLILFKTEDRMWSLKYTSHVNIHLFYYIAFF